MLAVLAILDWSAKSLDLNPIEHMWDTLGRCLAPFSNNDYAAMIGITRGIKLTPQELLDNLIISKNR